MSLLIRENVTFSIVGDGSSVTAVVDLSAAPLNKSFERRYPDRATVTVPGFTVTSSSLKNSTVTFTLSSAVPSGSGASVTVALEYDV